LPSSGAGGNLEHQLSKSGTAPALILGEVQAIKMKCAIEKLPETRINLRIFNKKTLILHDSIAVALKECNELIAIFRISIQTAKKNRNR